MSTPRNQYAFDKVPTEPEYYEHDDDADEPCVRICCDGCYGRNCAVVAYVSSVVLLLVGVPMLIGFGVRWASPYFHAQSFKEASCEVVESGYTDERIKCSVTAGKYSKKSTYKCVQVWVRVWNRENTTLLSESSFLQWNEYELYTDSDCSFLATTCGSTRGINDIFTDAYLMRTSPGTVIPCFYNPSSPSQVINSYWEGAREMVIQMLVWSSILTLLGGLGLILTCWQCSCSSSNRRPPAASGIPLTSMSSQA